MSRLVITKGMDGKLCGLDEKSQRAYNKFKAVVSSLLPGQTLGFTFRVPRSPQHHAFFFKKLQMLLDRTETFTELDKLRAWVILGAGICDFVPGLDGKPNAIPKSMDFDSMDESEFSELHRSVDAFLWSLRAQEILWPALNADQRWACMESFMESFQR